MRGAKLLGAMVAITSLGAMWPRAASAEVAPRILDGRPAPSAEATVALRDASGRLVCSGVLVAPRAVLTAAHCVPLPDDPASPGPADVCFGPRIDACARTVPALRHALHPAWDPLTFRADLAVVVLAEDAPATPAELSARGVAAGDDVEIVGYGRSDPGSRASAGEKRATMVRALSVGDDGRFEHGEGTCNGDSGGPGVSPTDPRRVVAITSSGPPGCRDAGKATLVAPHAAWIAERVAEAEAEAEASADTASCAVGRGPGRHAHDAHDAPATRFQAGGLLALALAVLFRRTSRTS